MFHFLPTTNFNFFERMRIKEVATAGSNLGKSRAEQFSFYPLLCVPNGIKWSESAAWSERSEEVILASVTLFLLISLRVLVFFAHHLLGHHLSKYIPHKFQKICHYYCDIVSTLLSSCVQSRALETI